MFFSCNLFHIMKCDIMKKKNIFIIVLFIYLLVQIVEFKEVVFEAGTLAINI